MHVLCSLRMLQNYILDKYIYMQDKRVLTQERCFLNENNLPGKLFLKQKSEISI